MRGYAKAGVVGAIREAGGEVYAITSEPQSLAKNAQQDWETGFEHVGDPHHEIAATCRERGWIALFRHDWGGEFVESGPSWVSHPKGYFQPGVLALSREGRVLYRWRCRPTRRNVGGAVARPTPAHVWGRVRAALEEPPDAPDAAPDADPELDTPPVPWALFVMLLLSNGWFLRPVPFDQRPGEDTVPRRQRAALRRIPLLFAAWVVAALLVPWWAVALAFAAWIAKIAPGVRRVNARFQNAGPDEEPA